MLYVLEQIFKGVKVLHDDNKIHLDLKLENVVINETDSEMLP